MSEKKGAAIQHRYRLVCVAGLHDVEARCLGHFGGVETKKQFVLHYESDGPPDV